PMAKATSDGPNASPQESTTQWAAVSTTVGVISVPVHVLVRAELPVMTAPMASCCLLVSCTTSGARTPLTTGDSTESVADCISSASCSRGVTQAVDNKHSVVMSGRIRMAGAD